MAEHVQVVLDEMVTPLRDLMDRGVFSEKEIHAIVTRRRKSEYLLHRLTPRKSDLLSYVADEKKLETLRRLRQKNLTTKKIMKDRQFQPAARAQSDGHIVQHIHNIYRRGEKRWRQDVSIFLQHLEFCKSVGSYRQLSLVYAHVLQHHPKNVSLWIDAASFEYFGDGKDENGGNIRDARVLLQRGLRINGTSKELWVQYFNLEMHYLMKLKGREKLLKLEGGKGDDGDGGYDKEVAKVVLKNAIKAIHDDVGFRLEFLHVCKMFPDMEDIEDDIMKGIERDFSDDVNAWIIRAEYEMKKKFISDGEESKATGGKRKRMKKDTVHMANRIASSFEVIMKATEQIATAEMYISSINYLETLKESHLDSSADICKHINNIFAKAKAQDIQSPELSLKHAHYLTNNHKVHDALKLLHDAVITHPQSTNLWLEYADLANRIDTLQPPSNVPSPKKVTPISVLKKALNAVPVADEGYVLLQIALFHALLTRRPSSHRKEAEAVFDKILLYSSPHVAPLSLAFLRRSVVEGGIEEGRRVYETIFYGSGGNHLNCEGMDSFFEAVVALEKNELLRGRKKAEVEARLRKIYGRIIAVCGKDERGKLWRRKRDDDVGFEI